ncbi:MAG: hypothetical protein Q4G43_05535 [Mobilicoccus sp.]|nr:hypothetical protein [Mobilicoccus sp.]
MPQIVGIAEGNEPGPEGDVGGGRGEGRDATGGVFGAALPDPDQVESGLLAGVDECDVA